MQEHEYKARDKTVQKMSRDGLREENLRNKEEKRITGRDTDTEISRSEKKEELDFSKRRHERLKEEREMEQPEQSSRKPRYSREHVSDQDINSDMGEEVEIEGDISVENGENPKSAFRTESIRGQPRGERAYLETVADSRDLRKKKMVRDYAAKERRKEKETSREEKAAKRESARYRETSEVMEDSLDKFHEEIKGKSKRERVLKEQRKKVSRLSFGDEGDGMVHGAGIVIRNPASAVKDAAVTAAHWKTHEEEDENAAVDGAHRAELVGESLARKSIYMRERLKGRREESRRLKESVLDEAERSRLIFETAYGNEAKDAVKREAEKKNASEKKEKSTAQNILGTIAYIIGVCVFVFLILHFVGQRTVVNGSSMDTTLANGQNLVMDKLSYRFHDPERYDIIIFPGPEEFGQHPYYIKRIIGMPGETVQIKDGKVYINDKELKSDVYGITDYIDYPGIAEEPITLGDDEYFCLGDNRPVSQDSRYEEVGPVKRSIIVGKVWIRIWPLNKFGKVS